MSNDTKGLPAGPDVDKILELAAIIREVDGNHSKGAAALAEALLSHRKISTALTVAPQCRSDEEILAFADSFDIETDVLKGWHDASGQRWVYSYDRTGYGDYDETDATADILRLARFGGQVKPVRLADRQPGPNDLKDGYCWLWSPEDEAYFWERPDSKFVQDYGARFSWVPHWAILTGES